MEDNKAPTNVIQFPGSAKKKESDDNAHQPSPPPVEKKPTMNKKNKATLAGSVLAVILFTGAVNRFTFGKDNSESASFSSASRAIASVEQTNWQRNATWEKQLAESLASPQVRGVASIGVGHDASAEENLRWGTLEEKYTIVFKSDVHMIDSITLQDATSNPTYILDRNKFLHDYGKLMDDGFASAELKSSEMSEDKTVETYTLFDKDQRPKSEARFELDRHKRLLSLKVEPAQI